MPPDAESAEDDGSSETELLDKCLESAAWAESLRDGVWPAVSVSAGRRGCFLAAYCQKPVCGLDRFHSDGTSSARVKTDVQSTHLVQSWQRRFDFAREVVFLCFRAGDVYLE